MGIHRRNLLCRICHHQYHRELVFSKRERGNIVYGYCYACELNRFGKKVSTGYPQQGKTTISLNGVELNVAGVTIGQSELSNHKMDIADHVPTKHWNCKSTYDPIELLMEIVGRDMQSPGQTHVFGPAAALPLGKEAPDTIEMRQGDNIVVFSKFTDKKTGEIFYMDTEGNRWGYQGI